MDDVGKVGYCQDAFPLARTSETEVPFCASLPAYFRLPTTLIHDSHGVNATRLIRPLKGPRCGAVITVTSNAKGPNTVGDSYVSSWVVAVVPLAFDGIVILFKPLPCTNWSNVLLQVLCCAGLGECHWFRCLFRSWFSAEEDFCCSMPFCFGGPTAKMHLHAALDVRGAAFSTVPSADNCNCMSYVWFPSFIPIVKPGCLNVCCPSFKPNTECSSKELPRMALQQRDRLHAGRSHSFNGPDLSQHGEGWVANILVRLGTTVVFGYSYWVCSSTDSKLAEPEPEPCNAEIHLLRAFRQCGSFALTLRSLPSQQQSADTLGGFVGGALLLSGCPWVVSPSCLAAGLGKRPTPGHGTFSLETSFLRTSARLSWMARLIVLRGQKPQHVNVVWKKLHRQARSVRSYLVHSDTGGPSGKGVQAKGGHSPAFGSLVCSRSHAKSLQAIWDAAVWKSCRVADALVQLNEGQVVVAVYGFRSGIPKSLELNEALLHEVFATVSCMHLPTLVVGDLNCDISQVGAWHKASDVGFVDVASRSASIGNVQPENTYRGESRLDYLLCNTLAWKALKSFEVDPAGFTDHAILNACFDWSVIKEKFHGGVCQWIWPSCLIFRST